MPQDMTDPGIRSVVRDMPGSKIGAIFEYGRDKPGIIPLWFGESNEPTPQFICDAAAASLIAGQTHYAPKRGILPLRQTIAEYMTDLYGVKIATDRINVTASGMNAIAVALQALVQPGLNVVFITPAWPNGISCVTAYGGEVRTVPLTHDADGHWSLDMDRLADAIDGNTIALFVNSPSNPTGWMMELDAMREVVAIARAKGIWIISDEVYARLAYGRNVAPSFLEVTEPEDRLIVVNSFSKTWAMTGWRLGWLTLPQELGPYLEKVNEFNTSGAATFVQHAGITAIKQGEAHVARAMAQYQANRDLIFERLSQHPRIRMTRPDATFYHFFQVEGAHDSVALARRLVDEANVGLAPGAAFGQAGEGFLRLCYASEPQAVARAVDRLVTALG